MEPSNPVVPLAQEVIRRILRQRIRCTLSDGRVAVGEFQVLRSCIGYIHILSQEYMCIYRELCANESAHIRRTVFP